MKVNIEKIKREMERLKLSVIKLAEVSGLSRQTIYDRLETDKGGNLETIEKIAKALELDAKDLLV